MSGPHSPPILEDPPMGKFAPSKPTLPPEAPPVPDKETDAEVKKKKAEASRLARTRVGLGDTTNTTGTGVASAAPTSRATLLGGSA